MSKESEKPLVIKTNSKKRKKEGDLYINSLISKKIYVPIVNIGRNIREVILQIISEEIEGKCIKEGYIKPDSIRIQSFSSGLVKGDNIIFEVVMECKVCYPVEGMIINCIAKNITKAGIRAEIPGDFSPVVIFIARDHNFMSSYFNSIKENQSIQIKVIGQRFELFDKYISVIGLLIESIKKSI